jgi:ornithine cyclodeaminase/alanine dehydrogenase-like protein (mu-crystallin family)
MTTLRELDAAALTEALSVTRAIDALEHAFAIGDPAAMPLRTHLEVPNGELLLMPAFGPEGVSVKVVTIAPGNSDTGRSLIAGIFVMLAPGTLQPEALIDAGALTALRTAAVSGLATRYLARKDATRLAIFGAGVQARGHLAAMRSVRPIEDVCVVGRDPDRAEALVRHARELGLAARVSGPARAARWADVICTCTTSRVPLFAGGIVRPGAHVNAVGAYRPDRREVDSELLARATVVVEARGPALAEAGDLTIAIAEGHIEPAHIAGELRDVVGGRVRRTDDAQVTLLKSVGLAFEDLVVARAALAELEP